ncbi:unnamed protein product [Durusdinium trenchii]|uniref:Uncharacterized protein n=1 Tax=Durusdinium trenchii TaxID=1381693 RepID=A0ABP0MLV4_9DINO
MVLVCASGKTGSATFARNLSRNSFARGFGGTNVSLVSFASKDAKILPEPDAPLPLNEQLTFWPGGGGELNHEAMPERSFDLVGSFSDWQPVPMQKESEGIYSYVLILGENRWEVFQIWLDGDPYRCLFPEQHKAASKSHVLGPEAKATSCWLLDGRPEGELRLRIKGSVAGRTAEGRGRVGSRWRVRLQMRGKWRMVDWERLNEPLASKEELPLSSYFVTADFNGWGLEQMQLQEDGSWRLEVHLIRPGGSFQILRNRDPDQTMYPVEGEPRGPDDLSEGRCWTMKGSPKELFSITLRRQVSDGLETRKEVHIERLGEKELDEEQICSLRRLRLSAFGTWEPGARLRELVWTGSCYHFFVRLGVNARESFQLLQDFSWHHVIHPSVANARPSLEHSVLGPKAGDRGLNWTIGLDGYEKPGDIFEVQVFGELRVERVRWHRLAPRTSAATIRHAEETGRRRERRTERHRHGTPRTESHLRCNTWREGAYRNRHQMLRKGVPDSREMPERVTWMVDKIYRTASEEHERCRKFLKALAILSVVLRECLEETLMRKLNRIGHQVQQARPDAFRLGKSGAEVATEKVELGNRFKWLSGTLHLFVRKCHDSLSDVDELEKKVDAFLDELTKAVQELQTLLEELQDFFQQIEAMKSHVEDESCRSRLESWQMKLIEIIKEELLTLGSTQRVLKLDSVGLPATSSSFQVISRFIQTERRSSEPDMSRVRHVPKVVRQARPQRRQVEEFVDIPVPQQVEEVVQVKKLIPQERVLTRPVEQILEIVVPMIHEEVVLVPKVLRTERRVWPVEEIVDVPVPQIKEEVVHVRKEVVQERIIHQPVHIPVEVPVPLGEEEVVKVPKIVQKTRKKQVEVEQVVDVPVHQVQEELLVTPVLIQKERLVHRPVQQIIEIPAPQLVEEEVPVPCVVEQVSTLDSYQCLVPVWLYASSQDLNQLEEDVNFRMVEQIVPVHRPQIVEKLVEVPKVQLEEKIIQVPMIQRNWVDTVKKQHVQVVETERPKTLQKLVKRRKPILQEKIVQVPKIVQEAVPVKKVLQREVEVPTVQWEERFVDVPVQKENFIKVPKTVERTVEVPQVEYVDEEVQVPVQRHRQVPVPVPMQRSVEVPEIQYIDKFIEVPVQKPVMLPQVQKVQKVVEVPKIDYEDHPVQVPIQKQRHVAVPQVVQKTVEVPEIVYQDMVVEIPVHKHIAVPKVVKSRKTVEVEQIEWVDEIVPVPVQRHRLVPTATKQSRQIHVPQVQHVDRFVDVAVPVPQVQVVEKVVEVPQMESLQGRELHEYVQMPPERRQAPREYASVEEVGEDLPLEIAVPIYEQREGVVHVEQKAMGTFPASGDFPLASQAVALASPRGGGSQAGCGAPFTSQAGSPFSPEAFPSRHMASEISQISQVAPFGVPASPASGSRVPQAFASQPQMASDISQISQVRPFGTAGCGACSATPGASPAERLASELSQISQVTPFGALPPTAGLSSGGLFEAPATTSLPPTVPPSPIGSMMSQWPTEQVLPMPSGASGRHSVGDWSAATSRIDPNGCFPHGGPSTDVGYQRPVKSKGNHSP